VLLSRHQNAAQNLDLKIGKRCFENVAQFRYLGTTIINLNIKGGTETLGVEEDIWTKQG
jgi:hypothetical protein